MLNAENIIDDDINLVFRLLILRISLQSYFSLNIQYKINKNK